jgi:hypothetical protein
MQSGAGARPEWTGKRLVALKRMKRAWEGGWDSAKTLQELAVRIVLALESELMVVTAPDSIPPSSHPTIRRIHLAIHQTVTFRFRTHGRKSLSTHQSP